VAGPRDPIGSFYLNKLAIKSQNLDPSKMGFNKSVNTQ
jgi:hypothetical protein